MSFFTSGVPAPSLRDKFLSSTGGDIAANMAPVAALALTVYALALKINCYFRDLEDRREFRQESITHHRWMNAGILCIGVCVFALKALEAMSAYALALSGAYIGCGVFAAIMLNNWVYQRQLGHDGRVS